MSTFALDTSCMVAAVCEWHERHAAAASEIDRRLGRGERLAVAAHALVETYAVLTRLPPPYRLAPDDAWTLVEANFIRHAVVVTLSGRAHVALLAEWASAGVRGGRCYDALIGAAASRAGAATLVTLNPRPFVPTPRGVTIVEPAG